MTSVEHANRALAPPIARGRVDDISVDLSQLSNQNASAVDNRDPFSARRDAWNIRARENADLADFTFRLINRLGDHAGIRGQGFVYHSRATLAAELNKSVDTIDRAIDNAEACDLLRVHRLGDKRSTNRYWPCLDGAPLGPFKGKVLIGRFPPELESPTRSEAAKMRPPVSTSGVAAKLRSPSRKNAALRPQKCGPIYLRDLPKHPLNGAALEKGLEGKKWNFEIFLDSAKDLGVTILPSVKKNWSADVAELAALGIVFDRHVLPVLEAWAADVGTVVQLSDLKWDADERRRDEHAHTANNEWRLPADVPLTNLADEVAELFRRAGWRPSAHAEIFADYVRHFEEDLNWFNEADEAVELALQAGGPPTRPPAFDALIDRYWTAQAAAEHPGWSFDAFAAEVARFPNIVLARDFCRRWESGCAEMAAAGLDFEPHVLPAVAYLASWEHGKAARRLAHPFDVQRSAESVRDLCWLRDRGNAFRVPDDLPITKYTRRGYELFCLAGWRPAAHRDVFATFNSRFSLGPFDDCWHTIEFLIASSELRDDPIPLDGILGVYERNREKILAWRAEGDFDEDAYHKTELPIDPRIKTRAERQVREDPEWEERVRIELEAVHQIASSTARGAGPSPNLLRGTGARGG